MIDLLLHEADRQGIQIEEHNFKNKRLKGLYVDNTITINSSAISSIAEKNCIFAEELGHYFTSSGNIINQSDIRNRKQEKRARNWAYEKLIPLESFVKAFKEGLTNRYEFAEFLGVTEYFLDSAIDHYKEKYGLFVEWTSYLIYFEPLGVLKLFDDDDE